MLTLNDENKDIKVRKYGIEWPTDDEVWVERTLIRNGGYITVDGKQYGNGEAYHVMQMQSLLWPEKKWHRWNKLQVEAFCANRMIGVLGAASTGKTHEAALFSLIYYFCFPEGFTGLISSTDSRSLELRIWGEIKKHWTMARENWPACPGNIIESRQMIVTADSEQQGRDFRNGLIGIPCVVGGSYVGLGKYVGVKNERVLLVGDELSFMGKAYVDAISNLSKNRGFKLIAMGNPKDPSDALGTICEPSESEGGWEGVIQDGTTRTWKTRWAGGIAVQLPGTDSPNMDVEDGRDEPYPFLIGRKSIQQDLEYYGRDSINFSMMCLGTMPRTSQSRRVITKDLVLASGAMDKAIWKGGDTFLVAGVDAAYSAIGGDRTVIIVLRVGKNEKNVWQVAIEEPPILVAPKVRSTAPIEDQVAELVMNECADRGIPPRRVYYDSTARGAFASALARIWSVDPVGVEFGGKPTDRIVSDVVRIPASKHFTKRVSELWFFSRYAIEAKQVRQFVPELIEEGSAREWDLTAGNLIDVERKIQMKRRLGKSPDIYDAFVVALEGARKEGFEITKMANMSKEDWDESRMFYVELAERSKSIGKKHKLAFT